jgi:putative MATE family efflux protein
MTSTLPASTAQAPRISVWHLAWPAVVTSLLQSMVGVADAKAVGSLGAAAMAAATAGHRLQFVLQALLLATSVGTTALVARAWGAADRDEAARVLSASLVLAAAIAGVMALLGFALAAPFARGFGLTGETAVLATTYIRWISGFNLVFAFTFVLGATLRGAGDMRTPLWLGVINNVVNFALLYLFVYGGLGAPKLGVAGAALAGGAAFAAGGVVAAWLWLRGKLVVKPLWRGALERERMRTLVRVALPAALEQLVFNGGFIVFTYLLVGYGTNALAAYGIGVQILSLCFVVGFGFSIAASTLVGQHLGAGDPAQAAASGWRAMRYAVLSMSVLSIMIIVFARPIARLMIKDEQVVGLTVTFIYLLGAVQPLMAIDFALSGALRGAGDTRFPLLTTISSLVGGRLLLAFVFSRLGLRVEWIYSALIADYIIKSVLLIGRFRSTRWQLSTLRG